MKHRLTTFAISIAMLSALPALAQTIAKSNFDAKSVAQALANREPNGLRTAAEAGLRSMINDLTKDLKPGVLPEGFPFDVNDVSDLRNAKLGIGFETYSVHPQTLAAAGRPLDQMLLGTGIWNFVVVINDRPVALLDLEKSNGKWQVNGLGAAKLAQDLDGAMRNHANKNAFRFVRIFQATSDFLEVQDIEGKARYAPLIAARQSLQMLSPLSADTTLPTSAEVLPSLQDAVRNHLAHFGK